MLSRPSTISDTFSRSGPVMKDLYTKLPLLQDQPAVSVYVEPDSMVGATSLTRQFGFCPLHVPCSPPILIIDAMSAVSDEEDLLAAIMPETMGLLSKMVKHF